MGGSRGLLVATVRAAGVPRPGGTVVVRDGSRRVGTGKVAADGTARVRLAVLPAGRRTLVVTHGGSGFVEPGAGTTVRVSVRRR